MARIGIDGGGGFVKICLSVFELIPHKERSRALSLGKKFKDSGVKKALIIGLVPDIQENYVNIKRLWISVCLHSLRNQYTIATDLKLCNTLLGLQSHSSSHPCCWCDAVKGKLELKGKLCTYGSLEELFWKFRDSGAKVSDTNKFGNAHPHCKREAPSITGIPWKCGHL